nr:hypothetical protein [Micromonospora sp. DSM 115978]
IQRALAAAELVGSDADVAADVDQASGRQPRSSAEAAQPSASSTQGADRGRVDLIGNIGIQVDLSCVSSPPVAPCRSDAPPPGTRVVVGGQDAVAAANGDFQLRGVPVGRAEVSVAWPDGTPSSVTTVSIDEQDALFI